MRGSSGKPSIASLMTAGHSDTVSTRDHCQWLVMSGSCSIFNHIQHLGLWSPMPIHCAGSHFVYRPTAHNALEELKSCEKTSANLFGHRPLQHIRDITSHSSQIKRSLPVSAWQPPQRKRGRRGKREWGMRTFGIKDDNGSTFFHWVRWYMF